MGTTLTQTDLEMLAGMVKTFSGPSIGEDSILTSRRQPIHTVYGGAHLFSAEIAEKFRNQSLKSLNEYGPTPASFARAIAMGGNADFHKKVYRRVLDKLKHEPIEDYRIDFEDGFGERPDDQEDFHAVRTANELGKAMAAGIVPRGIGIRIKPLNPREAARSARTLDLFLTTLFEETGKKLPANFVVTLPKISSEKQIVALVRLMEMLEKRFQLPSGILKLEVMVETPQMLHNTPAGSVLSSLTDLSEGRCVAAHFGPYDFTASLNITSSHQRLGHPVCDITRLLISLSLAGTGVFLSDGPTNILPVGRYREDKGKRLTRRQCLANRQAVHTAWRLSFKNITHALEQGYYQGWDLHPAQLPVRFAATYAFFLSVLEEMTGRLNTFLSGMTRVGLHQSIFDDAATGRGLINFFRRGFQCGALTPEEVRSAGLTEIDLMPRFPERSDGKI